MALMGEAGTVSVLERMPVHWRVESGFERARQSSHPGALPCEVLSHLATGLPELSGRALVQQGRGAEYAAVTQPCHSVLAAGTVVAPLGGPQMPS